MPQNQAKIVFLGTSGFAVPALKYLIQNGYSIVAVITQPEKPAGRQRITKPSPIKHVALENNIPVFEPHNLKNNEEFLRQFKHLNPELCVVAAYGRIIPVSYLEVPKYGFLNIHPSLLPKYRGPAPIQSAIMNGDPETGVSIMLVDEQMDHGKIVSSIKYQVSRGKNYAETEKELAELGAKLLLEVLPKYMSGEIKPKEQEHDKATVSKLLTRHDGKIDWSRTAVDINNQIRALNPEPGTYTDWATLPGGSKTLNIKEADVSDKECKELEPGTVLSIDKNIAVATKKNCLVLKQIQLEGKRVMDARAFANGHPDFLGSKLE